MADKPKARPYVQVASLFEKILTEKDGVISLIRMVDRFTVPTPPPGLLPEDAKPHINMRLVVSLKGGSELQGDYEVTIQLRGPTEPNVNEPIQIKVSFTGDHLQGNTTVVDVVLGVENYGNCSFDVLWYGDLLTRVPFRLEQGPVLEMPQTNSSSPTAGGEQLQ